MRSGSSKEEKHPLKSSYGDDLAVTCGPLLLRPCLPCLALLPVRSLLADLLITEHIDCSFSRISQELSKSRATRSPRPLIIPCPIFHCRCNLFVAFFSSRSGSCPLFNLSCQLMVLIWGQSIEPNVIPSLTRHSLLHVITSLWIQAQSPRVKQPSSMTNQNFF